ncbi:GNAT family N-acetyltransferase [Kitasatospora sp. NPDC056138]|uniref:GNAT family N-acetyltransferase n=1 Tax=Kitasatospora sp. NPDC056138 TaxID=3345724 RepID=UPI0035D8B209
MTWTLTTSPADFRAAAYDFLTAEAVQNTVLLTVLDRLSADLHAFGSEPPRFGWWRPEPQAPVRGAFLQTPPFGPRLSLMPGQACKDLAWALHKAGVPLRSAAGEKMTVSIFARAWEGLTGATAEPGMHEVLYRMTEPVDPDPAPAGGVRPAGEADHELLVAWSAAFAAEAGALIGEDLDAAVRQRIATGSFHCWVDEGRPVCFAGASPVVAGMSRIGPVYTPPELRGRGYASGLVAAVSAHAAAQGAEDVLLFADVANRTSNSIYQKLGYREVQEALSVDFD